MDERNDHGQGHGNGQPPDRLNGDRGDGRSPLGRFVKGCKPGPGNPFNRKLGLLRAALVNGLSERNMKQVAQKLLAMTLEGDLQACQMLLAYAHGPPPQQAVDPDRCDLDELKLLREQPQADSFIEHRLPMGVAVILHRAAGALAAVAAVAGELEFRGSRPHVLDALRDANLEGLAEAARQYADNLIKESHRD